MTPEIAEYLEDVRRHLHLDPATECRVINEMRSHFDDRVAEMKRSGLDEVRAARLAIVSFGRPRSIARQMYEAHSQGTWQEAALAALPHLLMAVVLAAHLWTNPVLAAIFLVPIPCVTLYGWWHGKPGWLYPWVGYSLLPMVLAAYLSAPALWQALGRLSGAGLNAADTWAISVIPVMLLFSAWVIVSASLRVVRRDWILASLMVVPLPVIGGWLFSASMGAVFNPARQHDVAIALALFTLAASSAMFVRLRQRVLKVGALVVIGTIATAVVGHGLWGEAVFAGMLATALILLGVVLGPALLEAKVGHGEKADAIRLNPASFD